MSNREELRRHEHGSAIHEGSSTYLGWFLQGLERLTLWQGQEQQQQSVDWRCPSKAQEWRSVAVAAVVVVAAVVEAAG